MSTTEETVTKNDQEVKETVTQNKFKFDWTKAAGYITTGVILLVMIILYLCGVVSIKNIDTACVYTHESVKLASMSYFTLCKDEFTPEKTKEIVDTVLVSIRSTTEQVKAGQIDLSDAKNYVLTEVNKMIDEKAKNPELAKQLAKIMIEAGFKSIETYSSDVAKSSTDYAKLLNAISTGIEDGYKVVYPEQINTKEEVKKTSYIIMQHDSYLMAA